MEMKERRKMTLGVTLSVGLLALAVSGAFHCSLAGDLPQEITNSIGMKLVLIPPGTFTMGDSNTSDSKPPHPVTITTPFYMGAFEVTNEQYELYKPTRIRTQSSPDDDMPVNYLRYSEAVGFCQWLTQHEANTTGLIYRLPHEVEWEYAAHGGKDYPYPNTDPKNLPPGITVYKALREEANYWGVGGPDRWEFLAPVGSLQPNGYGLYDMIGNVKEWCMNSHFNYPSGPVLHDPYHAYDGGESRSHMIRGNSYNTGEINELTVYLRIWYGNNDLSPKTGFRVVALLPGSLVEVQPLKANLSTSPTTVMAGDAVKFTGSGAGGIPPYSFKWNFGDGSSLVATNPTHIYGIAGTYPTTLTVTDARNKSATISATITVMPTPPPSDSVSTFFSVVASGNDDGQEKSSTGVNLDRSTMTVGWGYLNGFRFTNVKIPKGATILSAKLSTAAEATDRYKTLSLTYWGENCDSASPFGTSGTAKPSARIKTSASVTYANIPAWTTANAYYDSADLKAIIQQIVNRPGWTSGNALVILQEGTSTSGRVIWAKEGYLNKPPKLIINYINP
jgi:formylglycine-generating enzyme required for sulfatase activity